MKCEQCGATDGVKMEDSRTAYPYEGMPGDENDPNRPVALCRQCADDHHRHWDAMWAEYYNAQGR